MNIFYIDPNPTDAAQALHDKHVVKMTLETTQILSTVRHIYRLSAPYKPTHIKHPSVQWAAQALHNFEWLYAHGLALAAEYTRRYHKHHKCGPILWKLDDNLEFIEWPNDKFTTPPLCMPDQYKIDGDALTSYRTYYIMEKAHNSTWKNVNPPSWLYDENYLIKD